MSRGVAKPCAVCATYTKNVTFCSTQCAWTERNRQKVQHWLVTGEGRPHERRGHWMRAHLLAEQDQLCALCPSPQEWRGQPLTFVLDHINGDATDHRRENLRMICPNCNSQLPTHCGGNRGKGKRPPRYAKERTSDA